MNIHSTVRPAVLALAAAALCFAPLRAQELPSQDYGAYYAGENVAPVAPVSIPARSLDVTSMGTVADGVTLDTKAIQKGIDKLAKSGGGHLVVPAGLYLTGPLQLRSCIDLHLERGAVILFTQDKTQFIGKDGKVLPGIRASNCHDVAITGEGVVEGNGHWWRAAKRVKLSDTEWSALRSHGGTISEDGSLWYAHGLDHLQDIAPEAQEQERMRQHMVILTRCERVLVNGVTLSNSPKFHFVPRFCKDVAIKDVTVRCPWNAQNGDGIDIGQCERVIIAGCTVDVGDDGICMKGGGPQNIPEGPCKDIVIKDNTVFRAHGGFVIGSEFCGGMDNIVVRNCTFVGTDTGLRFKSAPGRGGWCRGVDISGIRMADIGGEAIVFETGYVDRPAGSDPSKGVEATLEHMPDFSGISIRDVVVRGCRTAIRASGSEKEIHGITISDALIFYYKDGLVTEGGAKLDTSGLVLRTWE